MIDAIAYFSGDYIAVVRADLISCHITAVMSSLFRFKLTSSRTRYRDILSYGIGTIEIKFRVLKLLIPNSETSINDMSERSFEDISFFISFACAVLISN